MVTSDECQLPVYLVIQTPRGESDPRERDLPGCGKITPPCQRTLQHKISFFPNGADGHLGNAEDGVMDELFLEEAGRFIPLPTWKLFSTMRFSHRLSFDGQ